MAKRLRRAGWGGLFQSTAKLMLAPAARAGRAAVARTVKAGVQALQPPPGPGDWLPGLVLGKGGLRRWHLYRPPGLHRGERLPLLVMLHGCGQDAKRFALSTRMNRVAARGRFLVLYPEQDRMANLQGCWNWFDTDHGRAQGEAALIVQAVDQVCLWHGADPARVAVAGLSAGASMAALLATHHPHRFKAVVMHSGVPPGAAHSGWSAVGAMHGRRAGPQTPDTQTWPWPPLLVIHGNADAVVAVANGRGAAQGWAAAAGATASPPRLLQRGQRYPMEVTDYRRNRRLVAQLVQVNQLGHAWSGGAARQPFSDARGPDASALAWTFIRRHWRA